MARGTLALATLLLALAFVQFACEGNGSTHRLVPFLDLVDMPCRVLLLLLFCWQQSPPAFSPQTAMLPRSKPGSAGHQAAGWLFCTHSSLLCQRHRRCGCCTGWQAPGAEDRSQGAKRGARSSCQCPQGWHSWWTKRAGSANTVTIDKMGRVTPHQPTHSFIPCSACCLCLT